MIVIFQQLVILKNICLTPSPPLTCRLCCFSSHFLSPYLDLAPCVQVLSQVPLAHQTLFNYICAFLRKCLVYAHKNNLNGKDLGKLASSIIYWFMFHGHWMEFI